MSHVYSVRLGVNRRGTGIWSRTISVRYRCCVCLPDRHIRTMHSYVFITKQYVLNISKTSVVFCFIMHGCGSIPCTPGVPSLIVVFRLLLLVIIPDKLLSTITDGDSALLTRSRHVYRPMTHPLHLEASGESSCQSPAMLCQQASAMVDVWGMFGWWIDGKTD